MKALVHTGSASHVAAEEGMDECSAWTSNGPTGGTVNVGTRRVFLADGSRKLAVHDRAYAPSTFSSADLVTTACASIVAVLVTWGGGLVVSTVKPA